MHNPQAHYLFDFNSVPLVIQSELGSCNIAPFWCVRSGERRICFELLSQFRQQGDSLGAIGKLLSEEGAFIGHFRNNNFFVVYFSIYMLIKKVDFQIYLHYFILIGNHLEFPIVTTAQ